MGGCEREYLSLDVTVVTNWHTNHTASNWMLLLFTARHIIHSNWSLTVYTSCNRQSSSKSLVHTESTPRRLLLGPSGLSTSWKLSTVENQKLSISTLALTSTSMPRKRTAETLSKIRTPREPAQLLTNELVSFPQLSKPAMNRMATQLTHIPGCQCRAPLMRMPRALTDSVKSV